MAQLTMYLSSDTAEDFAYLLKVLSDNNLLTKKAKSRLVEKIIVEYADLIRGLSKAELKKMNVHTNIIHSVKSVDSTLSDKQVKDNMTLLSDILSSKAFKYRNDINTLEKELTSLKDENERLKGNVELKDTLIQQNTEKNNRLDALEQFTSSVKYSDGSTVLDKFDYLRNQEK